MDGQWKGGKRAASGQENGGRKVSHLADLHGKQRGDPARQPLRVEGAVPELAALAAAPGEHRARLRHRQGVGPAGAEPGDLERRQAEHGGRQRDERLGGAARQRRVSQSRRQWKHTAKAVSQPRRQWKHKAKAVSQPRKAVEAHDKGTVFASQPRRQWNHNAKAVSQPRKAMEAQRKGSISVTKGSGTATQRRQSLTWPDWDFAAEVPRNEAAPRPSFPDRAPPQAKTAPAAVSARVWTDPHDS